MAEDEPQDKTDKAEPQAGPKLAAEYHWRELASAPHLIPVGAGERPVTRAEVGGAVALAWGDAGGAKAGRRVGEGRLREVFSLTEMAAMVAAFRARPIPPPAAAPRVRPAGLPTRR